MHDKIVPPLKIYMLSEEELDAETVNKLQARCVEEVKRINGVISFEDAYDYQVH